MGGCASETVELQHSPVNVIEQVRCDFAMQTTVKGRAAESSNPKVAEGGQGESKEQKSTSID